MEFRGLKETAGTELKSLSANSFKRLLLQLRQLTCRQDLIGRDPLLERQTGRKTAAAPNAGKPCLICSMQSEM